MRALQTNDNSYLWIMIIFVILTVTVLAVFDETDFGVYFGFFTVCYFLSKHFAPFKRSGLDFLGVGLLIVFLILATSSALASS